MAELNKENKLQREAFEIYYHLGDKRSLKLVAEKVNRTERDTGIKYSSNVVVLILSLIIGVGGTALMYLFLEIAFTVANVMCMVLMAVAIWVGAMVGYDKVIQMIEQVKTLRLK